MFENTEKQLLTKAMRKLIKQGTVSKGFGNEKLTCAIGALAIVACGDLQTPLVFMDSRATRARNLLEETSRALYPSIGYLGDVNDELGYDAVLNIYRKAIEKA